MPERAATTSKPTLGDIAGLFARPAPLAIDLGCGNGVFLAALAKLQPEKNFLGVERKAYRVRQTERRIAELPNAAIIHGDVADIFKSLSPTAANEIFLLFSDPWPKRRHAGRRLVQTEFVSSIGRLLKSGGIFFFASDSKDYAERAKGIFQETGWEILPWEPPDEWPKTEFEQHFLSTGVEIRRFQATR